MAGTVAVTANGTAVVGTGTSFVGAAGDTLIVNGLSCKVASVPDTTHLTLDASTPWPGSTLSGQANWALLPTGPYWSSAVSINVKLSTLIDSLNNSAVRYDVSQTLNGTQTGQARGNIGAAASGANSDITALSGLATALSIAQGGTGAKTAAAALTALGAAQTAQNLSDLDDVGAALTNLGGLAKADNLASVADKVASRTNLDLGGAAVLNVGTTSGTVAAGNDSRLSNTRIPTDGTVTDTKVATPATPADGIDALKLKFLSSGAGAIARSVQAALDDELNAVSYGMVGDGTTLNDTAFAALLAAAEAQGKAVWLPSGTYAFSASVAVTCAKQLAIRGDGPGKTLLLFKGGVSGLAITYTSEPDGPVISGLSILTDSACDAATYALQITSPTYATSYEISCHLSDIEVRGQDTSTDYWGTGIQLVNCWYPYVINPVIRGSDWVTLPLAMRYGIVAANCQAVTVRNIRAQIVGQGFKADGTSLGEGLTIIGGEMVAVEIGVENATGIATNAITIADLHIAAFNYCVELDNIRWCSIHDNLFFKRNDSTQDWIGVHLTGACYDSDVHDNNFSCPGVPAASGTQTAVQIDGASEANRVHHNRLSLWPSGSDNAIVVANANNNFIDHNFRDAAESYPSTMVLVAGTATGNVIKDNYPLDAQTLAVNSTTPSVDNSTGEFWETANTADTSVTQLTGGYRGQRLIVQMNDAHTGWVHNNSYLVLKGSVDVSVGSGAGHTISFVNDGSRWIETGRSF